MNYRLAILTTRRPVPYLHTTLASLLATGWHDPIDVYCDAHIPDIEWPLAHHDQFRFHRTHRRPSSHVANFTAALDACGTGQDVLILEDDVVFANGWQTVVRRLRESLDGQTYLLSLWWCRVLSPCRSDLPIIRCPPEHFTGTLGVLLQASYLPALRDHCAAVKRREVDLTVGEFAGQHEIPIYITQPSLLQHWGRTTSIGSFYAQSPTFQGDAATGDQP
jgi:hypothetical protein